jgi:dihydrodipicolinate synthase/N-acetylneuraminate lyase
MSSRDSPKYLRNTEKSDFTGKIAKRYERPTNIYQVIKEAMNRCGLSVGKVRLPMDNLTEEEISELREVLVKMGVL